MKRFLYARIGDFLKDSNILYEHQFGFRKHHSTNHALLSIVEEIRNSLDRKYYSCGVFVDLEKAFDTVHHNILLSKLDHYGIRGVANSWLASYLSGRHQKVSLNGVTSTRGPITCGVPQGSILGPLLFLIYINDMHRSVLSSTVYHFADDTNLMCSALTLKRLKKLVNKDLALLYHWLCANHLSVNSGKTEFIIFRPPRHNSDIRITLKFYHSTLFESSKIRYLGLILDNKLSWKQHISELCKKLSRAVGMLCKIRSFCSDSVMRTLYYSLFNSHLSYGLVVWGNANKSDLSKIISLQNKAIKVLSKTTHLHDLEISKEYSELRILKFEDQLFYQISSLMWDYDHNRLPSSLSQKFKKISTVHNLNTRASSHGKLYCPKVNTNKYGMKSFKYQGAKVLNDIKKMDIYRIEDTKLHFLSRLKFTLLLNYM